MLVIDFYRCGTVRYTLNSVMYVACYEAFVYSMSVLLKIAVIKTWTNQQC